MKSVAPGHESVMWELLLVGLAVQAVCKLSQDNILPADRRVRASTMSSSIDLERGTVGVPWCLRHPKSVGLCRMYVRESRIGSLLFRTK